VQGIALYVLVALLTLMLTGCAVAAGPLTGRASDGLAGELSPEARALIDRAYEGVDRDRQFDVHVHIAGLGAGQTGC
jgi:hypothetical protein